MLIVNAIIAAVVAVVTGLASPETCTTTVGRELGVSGNPVLQYQTCTPSFDAASTFIVGLLVFIGATVLELSLDARKELSLRRQESVIWRADDEATSHIHNILVHMREIIGAAYGENDRYVRFFVSQIVQLEGKLREAAEKKDLVVPSDEFQSPEDIDGAFRQNGRERLFRYTWPIDELGSVFTSTGWKYFFDLTIRMLAENTLTSVRALLVLSDKALLDSPNVQRLLQFYSSIEKAEARVVLRSDFQAVAVRNEVPEGWADFGIYDKSLLYVTEDANGRFTKDVFRIELYLRLFDSIWNSRGVVIAESRNFSGEPLSISQLLELDA